MSQDSLPCLSIGDDIPEQRMGGRSHSAGAAILGREVRLQVSQAAIAALDHERPIVAQIELYFSCMIRKQVRFSRIGHDGGEGYATVLPGLLTGFRAVTTKACHIADLDGAPPTETMPVRHPDRFVPDWLRIDFRDGRWLGAFGFDHQQRRLRGLA
ncbi:MAG TPA: hypothetical protein ENK05_03560 [Gammaproteobacteria bacterium]|nr:hypothetical protein [Gammaproteobacteria bacterium]